MCIILKPEPLKSMTSNHIYFHCSRVASVASSSPQRQRECATIHFQIRCRRNTIFRRVIVFIPNQHIYRLFILLSNVYPISYCWSDTWSPIENQTGILHCNIINIQFATYFTFPLTRPL